MTTLADSVPGGRPGDVERASALSGDLSARGVHGIVLSYVDTAGIGRVKTIPTARLSAAAAWGVGMSPVFDTFLANDSIVSTDVLGSPDGDLRLYPDLDQLTLLSAQPGWAWAPVDRITQDGEPHPACARTFLRRVVEQAARQHGVTFRAAVEIEWAVGLASAPGGEFVPEAVAAAGVEPGEYARTFEAAAWEAVRQPGVVAVKSVAAYRTGFDLDPARPTEGQVTEAAGRWLARGGRLADPVLVRHLLWTAVGLGLPLQLHTGFGDNDIRLHRSDPAHLTDWLHLTSGTIPVMLLHCWPYQRQAACLAAVFEPVYLDVGLTLHHVGPGRARAVLAEATEITPFRKLLYSSDAYGVAEFHLLGALAFRRGLAGLVQERVDTDELSLPDALRIARWAGRDNARRVYRFSDDI
ncbi:amidohydrolase family protein [Streptomyces sp. TRM72054]|uniref:amidohydrolase family protein n=1 Tax=Streptomyces sp. TRM72054 TaxID=2870562 RepID=UPI0021AB11FE|nr:amidohydrolase family protein [Streptomyces sp. TRM72054]